MAREYIGNTTCQALTRYLRTGDPVAGSTDPWSAGNGSLMRLAPVALRFRHDRPRLIAAAADQSRTTHGAEEAVDACRAFGALLADAIAGSPFSGRSGSETVHGIRSAPAGTSFTRSEAAIWSVARTGDFRSAVLLAANLADDADTVAAVTGQLAGALYGLNAIPDHWRERVAWKDRLLAAARRLLSEPLADW